MKKKIIITQLQINNKVFLVSGLVDEQNLLEARLEPAENIQKNCRSSILGNIYVGKVQKVLKNLNAAFVEIAPGFSCYYPLSHQIHPIYVKKMGSQQLVQNDEILVQVQKEGVKTKAPTVSTNLNLTGRYVVITSENTQIGISGKFDKETKTYYRDLIERYISHKMTSGIKSDGKGHSLIDQPGISEPEPYERVLSSENVKNRTISFKYGIIIRTNARNASDSEIFSEIDLLWQQMDKIITYARNRSCFSCLYTAEPKYLSYLQNCYKDNLQEIVTDQQDIFRQIQQYCEQYQDLKQIPLRLYEDSLLPLSHLYNLNRELERALGKTVWLKSGGFLVIEPTEALTVIDVNTGKSVSKKDPQRHFFEINLEASREIAKQLRLRNISGIIIIDFIDLEDCEKQQTLLDKLRSYVKSDPVPVQVHDMTKLNLVEVTRKKVEKSLLEQLKE